MRKKIFKKEDFIKNLSIRKGYSRNFSKKIINDLVECLPMIIKDGVLNIKNIGSFKKIFKKERIGRNPKTRESFLISSRNSVSFTASRKLIDKINQLK